MIHVENLVKEFGDFKVLHNLTFDVEEGDVLGFLGPNGAGKTTTMRILTCFFPPTSGKAVIDNFDVVKQSNKIRRILGYLPEGVPLYRELTVEAALNFFANAKGFCGKAGINAVEEALRECQLLDVRKRIIGHLSKGYRQRVGLAQAVIGNPKVLILDEPTVGLDPQQIVEIRELIKGMRGHRTVILSTHILPEVQMTCTKVLIINRGRIAAMGTPEHLATSRAHAPNSFEMSFSGSSAKDVTGVLKNLPFIISVKILDPNRLSLQSTEPNPCNNIASVMKSHNWNINEFQSLSPSLEDIYLDIVSGDNSEVSDASDISALQTEIIKQNTSSIEKQNE